MRIRIAFLLIAFSLQFVAGSILKTIPEGASESDFLSPIVRAHYRGDFGVFVLIYFRNGNFSSASYVQRDLIDEVARSNSDWMIVSFENLAFTENRPSFYNVFLVRDVESLSALLDEMVYETHHFYGLYTIFVEHLGDRRIEDVFEKLWNLRILNVVVVVKKWTGSYLAYSYQPYQEHRCSVVEPNVVGRYGNGSWTGLAGWFPTRTTNFYGCPLLAGTVEIKPFSFLYQEGNQTLHTGIEVTIATNLASKLNFTISYRMPEGNVKWGIMRATNSTGLVGMIQRKEVDFGFGCIGIGATRVMYLRTGAACRYEQLTIAISPKRPITSFEKLFQPFSLQAWLCVVGSQALISVLAVAMFGLRKFPGDEQVPHAVYTMWVLLMGGSCRRLRLDSSRLFMVTFILNMLVVRTLYHAAMFEKLQASDSLASDLNTFTEINKAGKTYYMHRTITLYFNDNPMVGPRRIAIIKNDTTDIDDILYALSQHEGNFVIPLPLDCIKYYVKNNGKRGLVYIAKHTALTYNTGFFYPKTTWLQESFSSVILTFHTAGLVEYWAQEYEDSRFWSNAKSDPEPASLQWDHISGAFYLCGAMLLLGVAVFFAELVCHRVGKCMPIGGRGK